MDGDIVTSVNPLVNEGTTTFTAITECRVHFLIPGCDCGDCASLQFIEDDCFVHLELHDPDESDEPDVLFETSYENWVFDVATGNVTENIDIPEGNIRQELLARGSSMAYIPHYKVFVSISPLIVLDHMPAGQMGGRNKRIQLRPQSPFYPSYDPKAEVGWDTLEPIRFSSENKKGKGPRQN
jgi:hypothetical protein